jgi:hypothetical protein
VSPARALGALALVVGLAHVPFVATTLEDIDSVNFALGVRDFDVAEHRPHPPGYPVYIGLGKVMAAAVGAVPGAGLSSRIEARALSLLSLVTAVGAVFLLYRVFASLVPVRNGTASWSGLDVRPLAASALTIGSPLVWTLAVRPMSDLPGLAFALAAQACLLTAWWWQAPAGDGDRRLTPDSVARSGQMIVLGALLAGLAVGVRTQTLWLTAPLLAVVLLDRVGRGVAGALFGATMTFAIGCLLWAVPLVAASGGVQGYLAALATQAGEDFASGEMLYTNPSPRLLAYALVHTFIDPWEWPSLGVVMLILAAVGGTSLLLRDRRSLAAALAMTVPYLAFHLLFQDTAFTRYAVPFVPIVAWLAVTGVGFVSPRFIAPAAVVLSIVAVLAGTRTLIGYRGTSAPAIQAVAAINAATSEAKPGALAMHQTFRRPLEAELVAVEPQLPSPPRREWLELVKYWTEGHDKPLWFLADPRRTDLALIDPQSRRDVTPFRWGPSASPTFGGMRPAAVDWIRMTPPGWFAGEGWSLTPETAGMSRLMGRGPHVGDITAWVRRGAGPRRVLIGGRNLAAPSDPAVRFTMGLDGREVAAWDVAPGFFLRTVDVPAGALSGEGRYATLTLHSTPVGGTAVVPAAVEQFDLQPPDTLMWGFDQGWNEAEYNPSRGAWRWTSDRSALRVVDAGGAVRVTMRFEPPSRYFAGATELRATAGGDTVSRTEILDEDTWAFDVPIAAMTKSDGRITIVSSRTFVPAEQNGGADRRRLGLRVFDLRVDHVGLR